MTKDDRDYYMYLRDRRITGNEYYPRVCIQCRETNYMKNFFLVQGVEAIDERPTLVKLRNLWNMQKHQQTYFAYCHFFELPK